MSYDALLIKGGKEKIVKKLAYLEKILYLWAVGVRGNRKNSLLERDEHRTPNLRNTAENQDTFVGWHPTQ